MGSRLAELTRVYRHRYIIEDPVRFGCLAAIAALLFIPDVPFWLTLAVVAVSQLAPVMMAARAMDEGWSRRWGPKAHAAVFASSLSMDFTNLCACAVSGAMLLVRHFNGVEVLKPLAILGAAICFLPDVRICRLILAGEPVEATQQLHKGTFLRDPVLLGSLLTSAVVCLLDSTSLHFLMVSLGFLQLNALLVFADKYLPEIEVRGRNGLLGLFTEREGRRFWLCLAPLGLIPFRILMGDRAAWIGASAIAAVIVVPGLVQLAFAGCRKVGEMFRVTPPPPPQTFVVLPKA
jgi:hypothetical protein